MHVDHSKSLPSDDKLSLKGAWSLSHNLFNFRKMCDNYMSNTVSLVSDDPGRRRLRSATSTDYHVQRTRTKFGDRAFSIAGPKAWNNLPQSVRSADSLDSFKRKLKFYLFNSYINV